jgi:hypothetical protein
MRSKNKLLIHPTPAFKFEFVQYLLIKLLMESCDRVEKRVFADKNMSVFVKNFFLPWWKNMRYESEVRVWAFSLKGFVAVL